jgi:peroxin-5
VACRADSQGQGRRQNDRTDAQWEDAFLAQEASTRFAVEQHLHGDALHRAQAVDQIHTDDELARTAGELIDSVAHESNPKFAQSSFLDLMRKLRDHEVAVEGNKVVEQLGPVAASTATKGKARASDPVGPVQGGMRHLDPLIRDREMAANVTEGLADMASIWDDEYRQREARSQRPKFQGDGGLVRDDDGDALMGTQQVPGATSSWEEDFDAASIVGGPPAVQFRPASPQRAPTAQQMEWDKLQTDWEEFEATSAGISMVNREKAWADLQKKQAQDYAFRPHNPYVDDMNGLSTRHHHLHAYPSPLDSVLMREADAQLRPHDPKAWYDLGVKQQENEREGLAISALHRAVELAPGMPEAWLALAVSYTNENDRAKAYDAIERWAGCRFEYADEVQAYRNASAEVEGVRTRTLSERHGALTEMLMAMARSVGSETALDADVQMALGVLFNTSEEYDKAGDCFAAAMSVRPEVRR